MAEHLFSQLCALLTAAHVPYQAFEDLSIRLLDPTHTNPVLVAACTLLGLING